MLSRLLIFTCFLASALATDRIFNRPKGKSFITIDYRVGWPLNTTTPGGIIAMVPVWGGDIKGQFNGHIVENITSSYEKALPSTSGEYTSYENQLLFENDSGQRILAKVTGTTTYGNMALHGFGYATLLTDIDDLDWINYEMFIAEWQADFQTGTAEIEIFSITTGGRKDGKPIKALLPPGGVYA
ncbi:hypothetical protein BGZ61DRAFT_524296 [Ilyonectria robusta]|uniref:uncharacterized protein n=1 Tax=Ilyonectria robusta TaxID=1079257 RepID=UPI001E8DAD01|nr:uncharacterized protein BGZ61DRAFT_524296 [Ilyonectria robusta]KAH8654202.1 hypothetical protein BGZ61DRAFT_524296 [Ilyonectria robusta]